MKKNIIMISNKHDPCITAFEEIAKKDPEIDYKIFASDTIENYIELDDLDGIEFIRNSSIWYRKPTLYLEEVYAVRLVPEEPDKRAHRILMDEYKYRQRMSVLKYYVSIAKFTLNVNQKVTRQTCKQYHLQLAEKIGFKIPEFIFTNKYKKIQEFSKRFDKIISKNISGQIRNNENYAFMGTRIVDKSLIEKMNADFQYPIFFQEFIQSDHEYRITFVSGKIYCAKMKSKQSGKVIVDVRNEDNDSELDYTAVTLPDKINEMITQIMNELELSYGTLDILCTVDGDYYFLEINNDGQYLWTEKYTNLKITSGIISVLKENNGS